MPQELLAMIAVQTPHGLVFGTARGIEGTTLHVEIDADIPMDAQVEWRMELPGLDETVLGLMRILRMSRNATSGIRVYACPVVSVSADDREIWDVWRAAAERGTRAITHHRGGTGAWDAWTREQTMAGSTTAERAHAVAQQEERRRRRAEKARQLSGNQKRWPDPSDKSGDAIGQELWKPLSGSVSSRAPTSIRSGGTGSVESRPRSAMASALRDRLGEMGAMQRKAPEVGPEFRPIPAPKTAPAPPPPGSTLSVPPGTRAPSVAPATPRPAAPPRPVPVASGAEEPAVVFTGNSLTVQWDDPARYRQEYERDLRLSALRVAGELAPAGARLEVTLVLPSGAFVVGRGDVVSVAGGTTGVFLQLDAVARQRLLEG